MELKLYSTNDIRLVTGSSGDNWIDCASEDGEQALTVMCISRKQYIEIREKDGYVKTFYFESKGSKKYFDFKWWKDADVVYALNNVIHEK
jgi:hypothetical protein